MKTEQAQTLKGFRDFLPSTMAVRSRVINILRETFESFGFDEIQTPTLEYQDVLLGKYGEEAEKLMYLFEDPGKRKVGLKYDLTVPLSRVAGQYPDLPKPFKRYQIQPVFRAEKPQKGRYREVYQCDIDIVGSSSPFADAEILAIVSKVLEKLNFSSYEIRINSRKVLFSTMEEANIPQDMWLTVIQSIDKLDKKSLDEVKQELGDKGLDNNQIENLFKILEKAKPDDYLNQVVENANKMGAKCIVFVPTLSRGLDYYTGPIFETIVKEPTIGSITGGGRLDNLIATLGGPNLPVVGTTFGLDRLVDVIEELNLWPDINPTNSRVLVTIFSPELADKSLAVSSLLRSNNLKTELWLDSESKLDKQLKYADQKGIPYVIIIGPEEAEKGTLTLKNLSTKEQQALSIDQVIEKLREKD